MSVVVWDGDTLATDCMASDGKAKWKSQKIWVFGDNILSGVGPLRNILLMREWYTHGADPNAFPPEQTLSMFCHFLVATPQQGLLRYETTHIAIEHGRVPCAFGEGRDFAYGALAMGANAIQAVEATNTCCLHSGMGVASFSTSNLPER